MQTRDRKFAAVGEDESHQDIRVGESGLTMGMVAVESGSGVEGICLVQRFASAQLRNDCGRRCGR